MHIKFIFPILLLGSYIFCQPISDNILQIQIKMGNKENQINYCLGDFGHHYVVGGMDIDEDGNIYIVDMGDNSIKKFNPVGEYLTKYSIDGVKILSITYHNKKLYVFDGILCKNDLYIISVKSKKLIEVKRHIFNPYFAIYAPLNFDDNIVFEIVKFGVKESKYQIFDLETGKLYFDFKSPFMIDKYNDLASKEIDLLESVLVESHSIYLGRKKNWFLFNKSIKELDGIKYLICFIKIYENSIMAKYEFKIPEKDIGELIPEDFENHWKFIDQRWLYFLGYRDKNILINKIDLEKIFPEVYNSN